MSELQRLLELQAAYVLLRPHWGPDDDEPLRLFVSTQPRRALHGLVARYLLKHPDRRTT